MRYILVLAVNFFVCFASVAVGQDARQYCLDRAQEIQIQEHWNDFRIVADVPSIRCRKDWVLGQDDELLACGDPRISGRVLGEFEDFVAARFNNGKGLTEIGQDAVTSGRTVYSSITSRERRIGDNRRHIFLGAGLAKNAKEIRLEFSQPITEEMQLTMCTISLDGRVSSGTRVEWPDPNVTNQASQQVFEIKLPDTLRTDRDNNATQLILIGVDYLGVADGEGNLRNLGAISLVNRYDCGECELYGIADLHVHQMAELAFAGRLLWGSHTGDQEEALAQEITTGSFSSTEESIARALELLFDPITSANNLTDLRLDANVLMRIFKKRSKGKFDDEGFVEVGTAGFANFENWPHHADRSHQQVHKTWLLHALQSRSEASARMNLSLMVVSVVNNNFLCSVLKLMDGQGNVPTTGLVGSESESWKCTDYDNLNRQIDAVHQLDLEESWYRVAISPWHAEQIIRDGDLAVMISMESDHPLSGPNGKYNKSDFIDILDEYIARGVRSLQPVHEADSQFCGAALHRGEMNNLQKWQWPLVSFSEGIQQGNPFNIDKGTFRNRKGLTADGKKLIDAMVSRDLPIDIAHSGIACQRDIMSIVPTGYALYSSHTKFERLLRPQAGQTDYGAQVIAREKNFLISEDMEQAYLDHDVMVGLRTASVDTYSPPGFVPTQESYMYFVPNDCAGSAKSFAQSVKYASDQGFTFAYGTDFNTGVAQMGPRFGSERCFATRDIIDDEFRSTRPVLAVDDQWPVSSEAVHTGPAGKNYYDDGLAHIGLLPELTWDLQREIEVYTLPVGQATLDNPIRGVPAAGELTEGAANFVSLWRRAYIDGPLGTVPALPTTGRMAGVSCVRDNQCLSSKCQEQFQGSSEDKVCGCLSGGTGCVATDVCATPLAGQSFCVVPDQRLVGETCFTDLACATGKCSARDGREGECTCRINQFPDGCREGTSCRVRLSLNAKVLFPGLKPQFPIKGENVCKP